MNLVTGATGILGSHVVLELLRNGQDVAACRQKNSDVTKIKRLFSFYDPNYEALFSKIKWIDVDIQDVFSIEDALEGITNVYHCAGFVSFNSKDHKKLFSINEKGTRNVVNACLLKKINALCHVSSIATVNNLDHNLALNEAVFWKTSGKESDYAISKYNAEREVWRGIEEGLNAVIVNPGVILGPGFWNQSSAKIFEAGFKGHKFYTDGLAGYVPAVDVARIMVRLVQEKHFKQRFILVENNYSFYDVFTRVNKAFGHKAPSLNIGKGTLRFAAFLEKVVKMFGGKEKILSRALINAAFNKQTYSALKVKQTLNFEFSDTLDVIDFVGKIYLSELKKPSSSV